jgi:hypothetical protein
MPKKVKQTKGGPKVTTKPYRQSPKKGKGTKKKSRY